MIDSIEPGDDYRVAIEALRDDERIYYVTLSTAGVAFGLGAAVGIGATSAGAGAAAGSCVVLGVGSPGFSVAAGLSAGIGSADAIGEALLSEGAGVAAGVATCAGVGAQAGTFPVYFFDSTIETTTSSWVMDFYASGDPTLRDSWDSGGGCAFGPVGDNPKFFDFDSDRLVGYPTSRNCYRVIDLTGYADDIDAGVVFATVSGWGNAANSTDKAQIGMTFEATYDYNSKSTVGMGAGVGVWTTKQMPATQCTWEYDEVSGIVPSGARSVRIVCRYYLNSLNNSQTFFDEMRIDFRIGVWGAGASSGVGAATAVGAAV